VGIARASVLAAAFELGRRAAWSPPQRGDRCLDPGRVHELMRHAAFAEREAFHVVLLDVRGRLLRAVQVAEGSLTQCPVSPRDALRPAVREGAHGLVFVHNHPSGDPTPSPEDFDLTARLRAAAELLGVVARDHVIVASGGYYSFVAAGRWRG
jgi:DNA repair protein RadC